MADGRTAYLQFLNDLRLFEIDLRRRAGKSVRGHSVGNRIEGKHPDSRGAISFAPDGTLMPLHNILALIVAHDGSVYATVLYPFTLLRLAPPP